jgi:hypothetical protein
MQPQDQMDYLRRFPTLWRRMNRCAVCQRLGYNPAVAAMPPEKANFDRVVKRFFQPLSLDHLNRCEQCAAALEGVG